MKMQPVKGGVQRQLWGRLVLLLACLACLPSISSTSVARPAAALGDAERRWRMSEPRPEPDIAIVAPWRETTPVDEQRDAADDPAIWIHPTTPALSTIIATNKHTAIEVYALDGRRLQVIPEPLNNVDLRYNFPLGGQRVALVVGQNRRTGMLAAYKVNPVTRRLENVAAPNVEVFGGGVSLYRSPISGKYYYFSNKQGTLRQYLLFGNAAGQVSARLVRTVEFGASHTEGVVADDIFALVYFSDEKAGIWRLPAEPNRGSNPTLVDTPIAKGGHLMMDVEGLAIYYKDNHTGYLIAASQGNDSFTVYTRQARNRYLMTYKIGPGNGIDEVTHTDGIEVTNFPLGPAFPQGLFVAQDDKDDAGTQNFKLVRWEHIARSSTPALSIGTTWDPRRVGAPVR